MFSACFEAYFLLMKCMALVVMLDMRSVERNILVVSEIESIPDPY